ncbi:MAG TPA: S8 family serine peptidase [Polyangia bacterium]|nr:S8 family serine peptidase [Polyangia bacterium]
MRKSMSMSAWIPWGGFAATLAGAALYWHGAHPPRLADRPAPTSADEIQGVEAAGLRPSALIVDYRDDLSEEAMAARGYPRTAVGDYSAKDHLYRIDFANPDQAAAAMGKLARDPGVESVDYDSMVGLPPDEQSEEFAAAAAGSMEAECGAGKGTAADFPNDACFKYQWHLRQIGMPEAWKRGTGAGAVVAVIDTGVTKVGDLAGTKFVPGYNFIANNTNADDDHGHGTHVAGTIAESTNNRLGVAGVAYGAAIMPLKVLSARGSGSSAGIAQAIRWAADHGANVINMSLGGPFAVGAIASAVKYAHGKGVVIVAAAGNDGNGRVGYPARYPGVIAVAATQFDESTTFYSNWGPAIDIAAPGGNVRVDQNGDGQPDGVLQHTIVPGDIGRSDYLWFMGTSMATPHVAGVAALLVGAGVRRPEAVEEILLATARKPQGRSAAAGGRIDDHYGAGIVDAAAALHKARDGRGAGELGLGFAASLFGLALLRRRGLAVAPLGLGFAAALVAGSSGLFFLPGLTPASWTHAQAAAGMLSVGITDLSGGPLSATLLYSALLPVGLVSLLYGFRRLRPALAGFGFGVAGALLFAAIAHTVDLRFVPDALEPVWLAGQAALAGLVAAACLRRA